MPPNTVCVARPTRWGNPWRIEEYGIEICLARFSQYVYARLAADPTWLDLLRKKNLACWCRLEDSCHADILLQLANAQ